VDVRPRLSCAAGSSCRVITESARSSNDDVDFATQPIPCCAAQPVRKCAPNCAWHVECASKQYQRLFDNCPRCVFYGKCYNREYCTRRVCLHLFLCLQL
jgi:hypothetical protein